MTKPTLLMPTMALATLVLLALSGKASADHQSIGVAGAVWGDVALRPVGQMQHSIETGDQIAADEVVSTGEESRTQLMFVDESALLIGSNAQVKLDQFIFGADHASSERLSILNGAFRFVSGTIARESPKGVSLQLPAAALVIRGTTLTGICADDSCDIWLEGTGEGNAVGKKEIEIDIAEADGSQITLRVGQRAHISADGSIAVSVEERPGPSFEDLFSPKGSRAAYGSGRINEGLLARTAEALAVQPQIPGEALEEEYARQQIFDKLQNCCKPAPIGIAARRSLEMLKVTNETIH